MKIYIIIIDKEAHACKSIKAISKIINKSYDTIKRQLSNKTHYRCNDYDIYITDLIGNAKRGKGF